MRKAFAFLTSSLSSINKFSSEETEASSTDIQKENNKSQTTISNTKNEKLSQNKHNNTNENPTKINNNNINSLNKIKKNNSNDFKKLDSKKSVPQLKKQSLRRKTSSRTTSSTTITTPRSSSNKLSVIKSSDNESETKGDDEEEEKDDDDVPLGLCLKRSQSVSSNYPPPFSQRNQVYYDDDTRIRNVSLLHNHSTTQDQNMGRYHYHYSPRHLSQRSLPVPTTPPLIHTSYQPKLHYFGERRFSSSASSSSSASADSSGNRYYRNSNNNKNNRCSTYSLPYWNEYEYDDYIHDRHRYYDIELFDDYDEHLPPPIERMRRDSLNNSSPCSRNNSFSTSRSTARRSNDSNCLVAGANPPSPNKYQKEATKKMSTAEYHRYQQEMVAAQYLKHGMNPVIDESIPINSELLNNTPRTLMQVQTLMVGTVNAPSTRPKRFSVIDRGYSGYSSSGSNTPPLTGLARRTSYTRTTSDYGGGVGNGGGNEINDLSYHRRIHSESTVLQQQISPRYSTRHHHHNTSLHLQQQFHNSATSLSSGSTYVSSSGSGGPPTPTSRKSSMMFGSNVR